MPIYNKSQVRFALDEINRLNPDAVFPATEENTVFGTPVVIPTLPNGANAQVLLRARQRRDYVGSQTFVYPRLDIGVYFKNILPVVTAPGITNTQQAVKNLNGRYGLNLTEADVEPVGLSSNAKFMLRIAPKCLQFFGAVECVYKPAALDLRELIVNPGLPVLAHPLDPKYGKLCAKMFGYNIDFSDHYTFLLSIREGGLSGGENQLLGRSDALVDLMVSRGYPKWSYDGAKFKVFATTAIADCNKQYDKVAVITDVSDPKLGGDIYLHFNS